MASDSWTRIVSSASKRHPTALHSQFDLYLGFEEMDIEEDDSYVEYPCPFCEEDFDVVGLCCHIDDEHPLEAKNWVCPFCVDRVGADLVGHLTIHHEEFFKMHGKRKPRSGSSESYSSLSLLKKELKDEHLHSLLTGSAYAAPPSSAVPDPLLSSFIYNLPSEDSKKDVESVKHDEQNLLTKSLELDTGESSQPSLPDSDQKERTQRSAFIQELLWSTIFPDSLCGQSL